LAVADRYLYGLVAMTCLYFLLNTFGQPSTKVKVHKWLVNTGFSVQIRDDEPTCEFLYVMTDEQGVRTNVYQLKNKELVSIEVKMNVPEELQKKFASLSAEAREQFIENISTELLRYGIGFLDLSEFKSVRLIDQTFITRDTQENDFVNRMFFVRNSSKLFLLLSNKGLGF
jgi:hypothetical protein